MSTADWLVSSRKIWKLPLEPGVQERSAEVAVTLAEGLLGPVTEQGGNSPFTNTLSKVTSELVPIGVHLRKKVLPVSSIKPASFEPDAPVSNVEVKSISTLTPVALLEDQLMVLVQVVSPKAMVQGFGLPEIDPEAQASNTETVADQSD